MKKEKLVIKSFNVLNDNFFSYCVIAKISIAIFYCINSFYNTFLLRTILNIMRIFFLSRTTFFAFINFIVNFFILAIILMLIMRGYSFFA